MPAIRFLAARSGGWLAIAAGSRLLVVDAEPESGFVDDALSALENARGTQPILDLFNREGLAIVPRFALLEWLSPTGVLAIVRGDVTVVFTTAQGGQSVDGTAESSWAEKTLSDVSAVSILLPGATAAHAEPLPLVAGAALVAAVTVGQVSAQAPEPEPAPVVAPEPEGDHDGHTMVSNSIAKLRAAASVGDHDGETVMSGNIAKLRAGGAATGADQAEPSPASAPPQPPAPSVVLVLPGGSREVMDQPMIVGRSPSVSQVPGGSLPKLLTVGSGDQDISRNHVQFSLEGGTVVVTDLHSRNGTNVVLPGKAPQKLRAGEPTSVLVGTVVDLGGGITFTIEES